MTLSLTVKIAIVGRHVKETDTCKAIITWPIDTGEINTNQVKRHCQTGFTLVLAIRVAIDQLILLFVYMNCPISLVNTCSTTGSCQRLIYSTLNPDWSLKSLDYSIDWSILNLNLRYWTLNGKKKVFYQIIRYKGSKKGPTSLNTDKKRTKMDRKQIKRVQKCEKAK